MKPPITVTAGRQDRPLPQGLPAPTAAARWCLLHRTPTQSLSSETGPTPALLATPCTDRCKVLCLPRPPILSFADLPPLAFHHCFPEKSKQNDTIQCSVYSSLNFEPKVHRSSRITENTVLQFGDGLAAICFLFIPASFCLLPRGYEIHGACLERFPACTRTTGLFDHWLQRLLFSPNLF